MNNFRRKSEIAGNRKEQHYVQQQKDHENIDHFNEHDVFVISLMKEIDSPNSSEDHEDTSCNGEQSCIFRSIADLEHAYCEQKDVEENQPPREVVPIAGHTRDLYHQPGVGQGEQHECVLSNFYKNWGVRLAFHIYFRSRDCYNTVPKIKQTMKKQTENTTQNTPLVDGDGKITPEGVTLNELQAENEQLKATIRLSEAHRQITGELGRAGARSPELLFNSVRDALQFADDGTLLNAAAITKKLRDAHPEQFTTEQFGTQQPVGSIDAGAGIAATPPLTRDALAKMKPAEIAELDWNDVKRVLAN